jgi:hypothetical protein
VCIELRFFYGPRPFLQPINSTWTYSSFFTISCTGNQAFLLSIFIVVTVSLNRCHNLVNPDSSGFSFDGSFSTDKVNRFSMNRSQCLTRFLNLEKYNENECRDSQFISRAACCLVSFFIRKSLIAPKTNFTGTLLWGMRNPGKMLRVYCGFSPVVRCNLKFVSQIIRKIKISLLLPASIFRFTY